VAVVLSRAYAETLEARPKVVEHLGRPHYFVPAMVLMEAASGEQHAYAKNSGLAKRIRSAMLRIKEWLPTKPTINGVQRRGYVLSCEWADMQPRTRHDTTWDAEFGHGRKY